MKTKALSIALAAFVVSALPASADDAMFLTEQKPTEYLAKDRLIGAKVHDKDGKIVGDIEDMIINGDQQVVGVIMGVGGFLGVGEKKVAVTTSALSLEATDGKLNVVMPSATKDTLTAAPAYKRVNPPKGWLQRAVEKGQELKDKSSVTAKDAYDKAKQEAGPAYEKAKEAAKNAVDKATDAAKSAVDKAKDAAHPAEAPKN
jgi:ElaB/YqjD/DUF883 family membrane-anchored ribosome-binding protein